MSDQQILRKGIFIAWSGDGELLRHLLCRLASLDGLDRFAINICIADASTDLSTVHPLLAELGIASSLTVDRRSTPDGTLEHVFKSAFAAELTEPVDAVVIVPDSANFSDDALLFMDSMLDRFAHDRTVFAVTGHGHDQLERPKRNPIASSHTDSSGFQWHVVDVNLANAIARQSDYDHPPDSSSWFRSDFLGGGTFATWRRVYDEWNAAASEVTSDEEFTAGLDHIRHRRYVIRPDVSKTVDSTTATEIPCKPEGCGTSSRDSGGPASPVTYHEKPILVQCANIPRSGHHMLVRFLQKYFNIDENPRLAYCEYYSCCKTRPCSQHRYSAAASTLEINLQKGHDEFLRRGHPFFEPAIRIDRDMHYLVQFRDPAKSIISDYHLLQSNRGRLREAGGEGIPVDWKGYMMNGIAYREKFMRKWIIDNPLASPYWFCFVDYADILENPVDILSDVIRFLQPAESVDRERLERLLEAEPIREKWALEDSEFYPDTDEIYRRLQPVWNEAKARIREIRSLT